MTRSSSTLWCAALVLVGISARAAHGQDEIYVTTNPSGSGILVFDRAISGNVVPKRTITGASTGLVSAEKLRIDALHDQIVVANSGGPSITVHALGANGDIPPVRSIIGPTNTLLNQPDVPFVDVIHNEIFVTCDALGATEAVRVFSRTASGDAAPLRSLIGASTQIIDPQGLWVDLVNNELYVANGQGDSILVFPRTASGNVAPIRTLVGVATKLAQPEGILVDNVHNELIVANNGGAEAAGITVYPRTASGNAEPIRRIAGLATGFTIVEDVALDLAHNELFVADEGGSIRVFDRIDSGNIAPLRVIEGASTGMVGVQGIAVIPWIFADGFELGNKSKWASVPP